MCCTTQYSNPHPINWDLELARFFKPNFHSAPTTIWLNNDRTFAMNFGACEFLKAPPHAMWFISLRKLYTNLGMPMYQAIQNAVSTFMMVPICKSKIDMDGCVIAMSTAIINASVR